MALKVGFIAAAKAVWGFTAALFANPITWIIGAVAALATAAYLIYKNWDWIGPWFKKLWDGVENAFRSAWEWIKSAASTAWNAIVNTIKSIFSPIAAYFDERIGAVKSAFDVGLIAGIQAIILNFHPARWIVDALDALTKYLFDFSLKDAGANLINSMLAGLKSAWESVVGWFGDIGKSIGGLIPESLTDFMKTVSGIGGGLTDAISGVTGGITDSIGSAFGSIGNWWGGESGSVPVEQSPALQAVQQRAARKQATLNEMLKAASFNASASVEFINTPANVRVASSGFAKTSISQAFNVYTGPRMGVS